MYHEGSDSLFIEYSKAIYRQLLSGGDVMDVTGSEKSITEYRKRGYHWPRTGEQK